MRVVGDAHGLKGRPNVAKAWEVRKRVGVNCGFACQTEVLVAKHVLVEEA